jgi:DNA (cytosine-5)-methyltransferase 1
MDIGDFNREVSHIYRGVDLVSAGFPCQAYSSAARGRNTAPDLWGKTVECLCLVEPRYVLLENVSAILGKDGPMRRILGDLASIGYDARWESISASEVGANHLRKRVWVFACDTNRHGESGCTLNAETSRVQGVQWPTRAEYVGVDDGLAPRMDRLQALGNGQVPAVVRAFWEVGQRDSQTCLQTKGENP